MLDNGFIAPPREAVIIAKSAGVPVSSLLHTGRIEIDPGATYKALERFSKSVGESVAGEIIFVVRKTLEQMYLNDLSKVAADAVEAVENQKDDEEESKETGRKYKVLN